MNKKRICDVHYNVMAHGLILRMNKTNMTLYVDLFPVILSAEGHNGRIQPLCCSNNN